MSDEENKVYNRECGRHNDENLKRIVHPILSCSNILTSLSSTRSLVVFGLATNDGGNTFGSKLYRAVLGPTWLRCAVEDCCVLARP